VLWFAAVRYLLAATLMFSGAVSTPQPPSAAPPYRAIVEAYRDTPARAVLQLLTLADGDVDAAVADATRVGVTPPWSVADLEAAALMHTDAGLPSMTGHDARGLSHIVRAERLLSRALDVDPSAGWFVQRWYRFLRGTLEANGARSTAKALEARSRQRLGHDAAGLVFDGITAELQQCGYNRKQNLFVNLPGSGSLFGADFGPTIHYFEAALMHDPRMLVAALHLGRIQMLQGNDAGAAPFFARAAGASDRSVAYLATLFLGALEEREGRAEEAERRYRAAEKIFESGQTADLALVELLGKTGRGAEAARVVDAMLERRETGGLYDPWWMYLSVFDDPAVMLHALKSEVMG
jgi:tetratricopeptide (TPR) repeat protein